MAAVTFPIEAPGTAISDSHCAEGTGPTALSEIASMMTDRVEFVKSDAVSTAQCCLI
jgi:hypothetical protein